MSRWKSPQAAARLADREAGQARRERGDKLRTRWMLAGVIALMLATYAGWVLLNARLRHIKHHHRAHPSVTRTNRTDAMPRPPRLGLNKSMSSDTLAP